MNLDDYREHLRNAARDEGLTLSELSLSPDGQSVSTRDDSGVASMSAPALAAVDPTAETAGEQIAKLWAGRVYGQHGAAELSDLDGLDPSLDAERLPEHPGHLGADFSRPPAPAAAPSATARDWVERGDLEALKDQDRESGQG
ncbi:MAG TPA: hypothetical protein VHN99_03630 [Deinococcales bacterium]|nr:hypothetical protein [Deinococcales bacterium]